MKISITTESANVELEVDDYMVVPPFFIMYKDGVKHYFNTDHIISIIVEDDE